MKLPGKILLASYRGLPEGWNRRLAVLLVVAAWLLMGMIGSQFVFGYYMAKIWQVSGIFPTER